MVIFHKDPAEAFTIWVDFGKGGIPRSQLLESCVISAVDDLGVDSSSIVLATTFGVINTGRYALVPVQGGVNGRAYDLRLTCLTVSGQTHVAVVRMRVQTA